VNVLGPSLLNDSALWVCYVSDPSYLPLAESAWDVYTDEEEIRPPVLFVSVPALPKGAMVEWQVLLHAPKPTNTLAYNDDDTDDDDTPLATKLSVAKINQGPIGK
jgi:diphthine-ammonia ligase